MINFKSTLKLVMLLSALLGLVFFIGCGGSAEKQEMSDFLKQYADAVDEYAAADDSKRADLKEKVDSFKAKWTSLKTNLNGQVTPQFIDKLDREYDKIAKKYLSLTS